MKRTITALSSFMMTLLIILSGQVNSAGYTMQDFANPSFPPSGWTVQNTSGYNMVRTTYCSGYGSGMGSCVTDFYDYETGNFELISPTLPVSVAGDSLIFDHAYVSSVHGGNDMLNIYTSTNNGSNWILLINLTGGLAGPLVTGTATNAPFVPASDQWATKRYLLPIGTNKIKFTAITGFGNNLYLDNIKIGTRFSNDVGVTSIGEPKWGILAGSQTPKVYVMNYGTTAQSFSITLTITPGGYSYTQNVTNLVPGDVELVSFNEYYFTVYGNYTLNAYTTLASDQNNSNNTISNILIVTPSPRKIVLEYCTATWCVWCPCGDRQAQNVAGAYPDNSILFAYHGAANDPWKNFNGNNIISLMGFLGYPTGLVDRRLGTHNIYGSFFFDTENRLATSSGSPILITTTNVNYNTGTRVLTVSANATALESLTGQYKVNYVITEDNLIHSQEGNSYCPPVPNAVHNWVVRSITNTVTGDNINTGGIWNNGQVYPLTLNTTLEAGWITDNTKFAITIFKDNGPLNVSEMQQGYQSGYIITGIKHEGQEIPNKYALEQNYPNPFNPVTNVHFSIPKDGNVSFKVYNMLGEVVATYVDGYLKAGKYNAEIEAYNWASGTYFYSLTAGDYSESKKMMLVK